MSVTKVLKTGICKRDIKNNISKNIIYELPYWVAPELNGYVKLF